MPAELAVGFVVVGRRVRTGKTPEQVIGRAIFLKDDDDVLNRFRERRSGRDTRNRGARTRRETLRLRASRSERKNERRDGTGTKPGKHRPAVLPLRREGLLRRR